MRTRARCRVNGTRRKKITARSWSKIRRYPGIHFRLARLLLSKPNPAPDFAEQAKKELQAELEIDPANAGAEYVLGELARQAQDLPEAVKHFSKATQLEPNFADAYLGLGMSLLAQKKYAGSGGSAGEGGQASTRESRGALQPGDRVRPHWAQRRRGARIRPATTDLGGRGRPGSPESAVMAAEAIPPMFSV